MFSKTEIDLATKIIKQAASANLKIATAESCTGGLISALLTDISGASSVYDCGFATYSNQAKQSLLSVPEQRLIQHGAVSAEIAQDMAQGVIKHSQADIAITTTGIAGPTGATKNKPVGLVYFGIADKNGYHNFNRKIFSGNRQQVRHAAVMHALLMILDYLEYQEI